MNKISKLLICCLVVFPVFSAVSVKGMNKTVNEFMMASMHRNLLFAVECDDYEAVTRLIKKYKSLRKKYVVVGGVLLYFGGVCAWRCILEAKDWYNSSWLWKSTSDEKLLAAPVLLFKELKYGLLSVLFLTFGGKCSQGAFQGVNLLNSDKQTILQTANQQGNAQIIRLLSKAGIR